MSVWEKLTPLLVHIQANLDQDLSLVTLGDLANLSPSHLQRVFTTEIGESPKRYVTRLRVERAAFCLLVHGSSVARIAADCGFQSPETFIRAFRRRFGKAPSAFRTAVRGRMAEWNGAPNDTLGTRYFEISTTRLIDIRPVHVAFRRHIGPYEDVPESLFYELERWADRRRLTGPRIWMGIGHDAPIATSPDNLRFDAAVVVPGPFQSDGLVGYQLLAGGLHAVTTHVGPYETLGAAYGRIFPRLETFKGYVSLGLPAVEVYHTVRVNVRFALNQTDLCLPMRRLSGSVTPAK